MSPHYIYLVFSYFLVVGLWFLLNRLFPKLWPQKARITFEKPFSEFIFSLLAVIAILGIGQLYIHDLLIPDMGYILLDALNQFIIFSPTLVLLIIRKQSTETIWLSESKILIRLLTGFLMALCGITTYWLTREDANELSFMIMNIYHYQNISYMVQVFMEDVTIALIFVRLAAWIGRKRSIFIVAILFAAGHIPSLLAGGAMLPELGSLLIDAMLGVVVLTAVSRSRDILWFFMVHFAMDMTQFYGS